MTDQPEKRNPFDVEQAAEHVDTPLQDEAHDIDQALARYVELGWHLVPMNRGDKTPKITKWQEAASNDMDVIRGWREKWPDANFAVAAGLSGLAIVDIDSAKGKALLEKVMGNASSPTTPVVTTGRGEHLYHADPGGMKPNVGEGLDLRAGSSLAILPPSVHPSGVSYRWLRGPWEVTPPAMPPQLVQHFKGRRAGPAAGGPIPEGRRNETLFREACRLRAAGLDAEALEEALLAMNAAQCQPPLPADETRQIAASAAQQPAGSADRSQTEQIMEITYDVELFHTPDQRAFASVKKPTGRETWYVRDHEFNLWLRRSFHGLHGRSPRAQPLVEAILQIEAHAMFGGDTKRLHVRLAGGHGVIHLDLADEHRQVVRITPNEWKVETASQVAFRRPKGLQALPTPSRGGSVDELRRFVNVTDDATWKLLVGWLVAALHPDGPYPVLVLSGEQGSAKSTCARLIRSLVDPNVAPLRAASRNPHDLLISATNSWCVVMDNLSSISADMSDALCRLATGGGFATRTLYENDQETILDAQRPVILTGIGDLIRRSDLLDRALIIRLPPIPETARRTEAELWNEFEAARPGILGALLDAVAGSLARHDQVRLERPPRMADFATRVTAAERALGWADGAFMDAYRTGRADANSVALESSPVIAALERVVGPTELQKTSQALLQDLEKTLGDRPTPREWPANAQALSTILQQLAPNLRETGWHIDQMQTSGTGSRRLWHIRKPA